MGDLDKVTFTNAHVQLVGVGAGLPEVGFRLGTEFGQAVLKVFQPRGGAVVRPRQLAGNVLQVLIGGAVGLDFEFAALFGGFGAVAVEVDGSGRGK